MSAYSPSAAHPALASILATICPPLPAAVAAESIETSEDEAQPYVAPVSRHHVTKVLVTVTHERPIPDLAAHIAARAWTIDGVVAAEGGAA